MALAMLLRRAVFTRECQEGQPACATSSIHLPLHACCCAGDGRRAAEHLLQWSVHQRCPDPEAFTAGGWELLLWVFHEGLVVAGLWGSGKQSPVEWPWVSRHHWMMNLQSDRRPLPCAAMIEMFREKCDIHSGAHLCRLGCGFAI